MMDDAGIERLIGEVIQSVMENPSLPPGSRIIGEEVASWDSLHQMKVLIGIEEKFGIGFAPSEIVPPKSKEHLVKLVRQKLEVQRP